MVSASARGLDFMVKHGIKGAVGGGAATMERGPITASPDAAARAGMDWKLGENLMIGVIFNLADYGNRRSRKSSAVRGARQDVRPARFHARRDQAQIAAIGRRGGWAEAGVPTVEHYIEMGAWFAGPPEGLVAYLRELEERYPGMEHINLSTPMGTPEAMMLEQFGWSPRQ